jgi:hypothetical protein
LIRVSGYLGRGDPDTVDAAISSAYAGAFGIEGTKIITEFGDML